MADEEEALLRMYRGLDGGDRSALVAFAEFLSHRSGGQAAAVPSPKAADTGIEPPADIPRPAEERVIAAVKRLSLTYPMLDKTRMLNMTSTLVTAHVVQGREAAEVIDELEEIFRQEYRELAAGNSGDG